MLLTVRMWEDEIENRKKDRNRKDEAKTMCILCNPTIAWNECYSLLHEHLQLDSTGDQK